MSISKIKVACGFGVFLLFKLGVFLMYLVFKIIPLESQKLLLITLYLLCCKYISTCLKGYWKEVLNELSFANGWWYKQSTDCKVCALQEHSSLLGYKNNCFLLSHANSALSSECVSLTAGLAEHSKPPKLGVLLRSRLGKQASVSSADTQAAAINTAKPLSTGKVGYIPWHC